MRDPRPRSTGGKTSKSEAALQVDALIRIDGASQHRGEARLSHLILDHHIVDLLDPLVVDRLVPMTVAASFPASRLDQDAEPHDLPVVGLARLRGGGGQRVRLQGRLSARKNRRSRLFHSFRRALLSSAPPERSDVPVPFRSAPPERSPAFRGALFGCSRPSAPCSGSFRRQLGRTGRSRADITPDMGKHTPMDKDAAARIQSAAARDPTAHGTDSTSAPSPPPTSANTTAPRTRTEPIGQLKPARPERSCTPLSAPPSSGAFRAAPLVPDRSVAGGPAAGMPASVERSLRLGALQSVIDSLISWSKTHNGARIHPLPARCLYKV
jgi:hypothetical protein